MEEQRGRAMQPNYISLTESFGSSFFFLYMFVLFLIECSLKGVSD